MGWPPNQEFTLIDIAELGPVTAAVIARKNDLANEPPDRLCLARWFFTGSGTPERVELVARTDGGTNQVGSYRNENLGIRIDVPGDWRLVQLCRERAPLQVLLEPAVPVRATGVDEQALWARAGLEILGVHRQPGEDADQALAKLTWGSPTWSVAGGSLRPVELQIAGHEAKGMEGLYSDGADRYRHQRSIAITTRRARILITAFLELHSPLASQGFENLEQRLLALLDGLHLDDR
jgi:hypothetical protein